MAWSDAARAAAAEARRLHAKAKAIASRHIPSPFDHPKQKEHDTETAFRNMQAYNAYLKQQGGQKDAIAKHNAAVLRSQKRQVQRFLAESKRLKSRSK